MINFFPRLLSQKAIYLYCFILIFVSLCFYKAIMDWYWMAFGAISVCGFFYVSTVLSERLSIYPSFLFEKKIFWYALSIRAVYVVFSYFFYDIMTGQPFEFSSGDALFYDDIAKFASRMYQQGHYSVFFEDNAYTHGLDVSDTGYPFYLGFIYSITGNSILIARLIKAVISSFTCVLVYRFALRNFGDGVAKIAAIFCMLMPNFIYYCGLHLKETEMIFLVLLFMERGDYAIRNINSINWIAWVVAFISAMLLFTFRTVLGAVAIMSLITMIVLTTQKVMSTWKKVALGFFLAVGLVLSIGDSIMAETSEIWESRSTKQEENMQWRSVRENGNKFAKYASGAVFAPIIFTIPFPTMIDVQGQENQQMIHGGNFVKNILSVFTIYSIVLLVITGDWRKHVMILAFTGGYLIVIAASSFAQSERFHLPVLPFELILAAYGVTHLKVKYLPWYDRWLILMFFINIAWAWFKLKGRGMI